MSEDRIGVFVRIRPYQEKEQPSTFILNQTTTEITVKDKDAAKEQDHRFTYDHIFSSNTEQLEVFQKIGQPIVDSAFEGINGTIFAYGQTSSGKTYTCVGPDCDDENLKGLLPRCVESIFQRISNSPNYFQYRIKISMVQIYMEKIRDLLDSSKLDLKIRENKTKGIYIQDVTEEYVSSAEETLKIFKKGVSNRAVAFTNMNDFSSRSHMAFILTLHQNNLKDGSAKSGKITVVDLAGSEKVSKTQAEGKILGEAKQINKSLSSLGNVINALTDCKVSHIPYRDSKLTRLLQESLGGNSKTHLIINISPSAYNGSESVSSLRFGYRAKEIKNKPKINKQYTIPELLVLLEKAEKRNQQLQLLLNELTSSKKVKKKQTQSVQNLLQSDNPLASGTEEGDELLSTKKKSTLNTIKKYYASQIGQDSEEDDRVKIEQNHSEEKVPQQQKQELQRKLKESIQDKEEELSILGQQLSRINSQRVNLGRQLDISRQKLEVFMKEARVNAMKFNSQKRQNQNLLQKYIKQNLESQEKDQKISALHSKIVNFEEKMLKLSQLHKGAKSHTSIFGTSKNLNQQSIMIIESAVNDIENQEFKKEALQEIEKEKVISKLASRIKELETQLSTYEHLQQAKEGFIKEKLKFMAERDQIFKDLENRVLKVTQLEEELDSEREKRMYFQTLISMEESQKNRKILSLQRHIQSISEEYYVLKGQQSSWKRNNQKIEKKNSENFQRILHLESENLELKAQIQSLTMKCQEFESMNQNSSVFDFQLSQVEPEGTGNIVKVVRSMIAIRVNNQIDETFMKNNIIGTNLKIQRLSKLTKFLCQFLIQSIFRKSIIGPTSVFSILIILLFSNIYY